MSDFLHLCRPNCGACCIAPSISSPIPGMPNGKPAGIKCIHLSPSLLCTIIDSNERPIVCNNFSFDPLICGDSQSDALQIMNNLEK